MSKCNLLFYIHTSSDANSSNNPSLSNFKWSRDVTGLAVTKSTSDSFTLAPGESKTLFDGSRTLTHDGSTQYSLTLKPLSTNTYILTHTAGTAPTFRTTRATSADATTQVTVTVNGTVATYASTGGTAFNLAGLVVGDYVRIGTLFNTLNQGEWKIISLTATSFSVVNDLAAAEGPITLSAGFASQIKAYSASGAQIGDTIKITGGFSPVSRKSFKLTSVADTFVEFYSTDVLPQESSITTSAFNIYSNAKQLVYLEANELCSLTINGVAAGEVEPFVIGSSTKPGMFVRKSTLFSMSVTNSSTDIATLFIATIE